MNRKEHLDWAKQRAFKILDNQQNSLVAWNLFKIDMKKHDELENHIAIALGDLTLPKDIFAVHEYRKFIDGFN